MSADPSSPQDISSRTTGGTPRWEPPSPEELQAQMPGYTIEKLLGRGGMGAVYKGVQTNLDRPVAIKILPPGVEREDPSFAERFKNEAKLMAKLNHPGVVAVHDFGTTLGGQLYFAMEFVDGTDVSQMIRSQGKLPPDHALAITAHVCDALAAAHELGIVHRDIKPANVLINMKGQVKVADFGLAKVEEPGTHGLTKTGYAMGTPDFVAPEVLMLGSHIDGRADLYAVGVMLYQMLTGEIPRGAFKPATARLPGLDPRFDPIIVKAMQTDREERYQSSAELRRDLDVILTVPLVRPEETPAAQVAQTPPARLGQRQEGGAGMPVRKQPPSAQPGPTYLDDGPAGQASPARAATKKPKSQAPLILGLGVAAALGIGAFVMFSGEGRRVRQNSEAPANTPSSRILASSPASTPGPPKAQPKSSTPVSPPPAPQVSPSSVNQLPFGKWVKVAGSFDGAKSVPLKDGRIQFQKGNRLTLGDLDYENVVVRLRVRQQSGYAEIRLRETPSSRVAVQVWPHEIKSSSQTTTLLSRQKLEPAVKSGEEGILVGALLNGKIYGRWNDTAAIVSADPTTTGTSRRQLLLITGDKIEASDIEYAILDGLSEAEALKVIGVDEKGKDLRQQPAAITATPMPPPTSSPAPSAPTTPSPSPPVSSTPAPAAAMAATPASELDQRLAALESSFQAAVERDANAAFKASMAALDKSYLGALDRALATATSGGKLEEALALREEKQRIEKGEGVPSEVDESTLAPGKVPDTLKTLRKTYRSTTAQHEATKAKAMQPLYDKYDQALAAVQTELTQAQKLDDALRVKTVREQIAITRSGGVQPPGASPVASTTNGSAPASSPATGSTLLFTDSKDFTNSLGMKFVKVSGTDILMCIHETRKKDYAVFAAETPGLKENWKNLEDNGLPVSDGDDHPVVGISWEDAKAFCAWLSKKEGRAYRLPTDMEWSFAVGIGRDEKRSKDSTPESLSQKIQNVFPWGTTWPPPQGAGNYGDELFHQKFPNVELYLKDYNDGYIVTAPVMSFKPNKAGIYDLGGNVEEWCEDWFNLTQTRRVARGNGWNGSSPPYMWSSLRSARAPEMWSVGTGFRLVVETRTAASTSGAAAKANTPPPTPPAATPPAPATAAKSDFTNSLGMKFVKVPGTKVLFCIHETRKGDYAKYAAEEPGVNGGWKTANKDGIPVGDKDDHPVVSVNWDEANAFCTWLSQKEGRKYRLPTDREWSFAVGIGRDENWTKDTTPQSLQLKIKDEFPWGRDHPSKTKDAVGNYADTTFKEKFPSLAFIEGYTDGFATTAPVMSFKPNKLGLYDLGGNVEEWVEDSWDQTTRILRGGYFSDDSKGSELQLLLSSWRNYKPQQYRIYYNGFRIVLETNDK